MFYLYYMISESSECCVAPIPCANVQDALKYVWERNELHHHDPLELFEDKELSKSAYKFQTLNEAINTLVGKGDGQIVSWLRELKEARSQLMKPQEW